MQAQGTTTADLHFEYVPAYAQFLLDHYLKEFATASLRLSRELNPPLLEFFRSYTDEQLIVMGEESARELLTFFAQNRASAFIKQSVDTWLANQLPNISRDKIQPEDITLVSFIRRKIFRDLLPNYTNDARECLNIIEEIDRFTTELDTTCFSALCKLQHTLHKETQELAHIGNWAWDLQANHITWSDEIFRIYELEPQAHHIVTHDLRKFNHPDDQAMITEQMERSRENLQPHDFYYRIILGNGTEKTLHTKGYVRVDENGKAYEMFGTLQDVTEQKRQEKHLAEQQHFIRKITDITPSLIGAYNVKTGNYLFVNQALKTLLGYEPKDLMEQGISFLLPLIHPDDMEHVMQENTKALEAANSLAPNSTEPIVEFQYRVRHQDGRYRWFRTYGTIFSRDKRGHVEEILNISVDITDQMEYASELQKKTDEIRSSEERYHKMIDEIKDYAIVRLNENGTIENWNQGAENIKGYAAGEIIGKHISIFYPAEDQLSRLPETLLNEARVNGKATHEGWRVRKDGSMFWCFVVITALHDDNGNVIGFTKITRDLTDKKIAEDKIKSHARMLDKYAQRLEEKNDALERSYKELESFSYIASHDLQEPLRKIKIFLNLIAQKEQISENARDYFNRIISASDHMQSLIDALLTYSQMNLLEIVPEKTDLNKVLDDVKKNLSSMIEEKNVLIESTLLPTLKVVPMQFQQLFSNIISNAVKYSKKGEQPHIRITADIVPAQDMLPNPATNCYKISFSDNGIGFEQQYSERIFQLFQRLHGKSEYPGTGIGLAICKKIVQNHGGTMDAVGEPGVGATFNIYLPVEKS